MQRITRRNSKEKLDRYGGYGATDFDLPSNWSGRNSDNASNSGNARYNIEIEQKPLEYYDTHANPLTGARVAFSDNQTQTYQEPVSYKVEKEQKPTFWSADTFTKKDYNSNTLNDFSYSKANQSIEYVDTESLEKEEASNKKYYKKYAKGEIMPSIARHSAVEIAEKPRFRFLQKRNAAVEQEQQREKITASDKRMLVIYLAVVVAIVVAIIATGIAIGQAGRAETMLNEQIAVEQQVLALQEAELARLSDPAHLALLALGQGMIPPDNYTPIDLIELTPPPEVIPPTNWFDRLSRFVGRLF